LREINEPNEILKGGGARVIVVKQWQDTICTLNEHIPILREKGIIRESEEKRRIENRETKCG